jgi:DeoR/GlpR family transcriptional regulator of sugar metabolism
MRPLDRQSRIIDTVRARGKASVDELAEMFGASVETIRRDLTALARKGQLEKIHGGAIPRRTPGEGPFEQRMQQNGLAKRHIAQKLRKLVSPGDTLLIDTGSTTLVVAEELAAIDDLTIVTNSTAIARAIATGNRTASIFLLGGNYIEDNRQTCGIMALEQLNQFHGNLAILTVAAVDAEAGLMDYSFDEAQMARAMLGRADRVIALADSSKFGQVAPFVVAGFEQVDVLVCEQPPTGSLARRLQDARVEVID